MFSALLDTINTILGLILDGAKLPPSTTPDTLASALATAVSLFTGRDPDDLAEPPKGSVGPKAPEMAQMAATMSGGEQIKDLPKVIACLNELLKASEVGGEVSAKTKAGELGAVLTNVVMEHLKGQVKGMDPVKDGFAPGVPPVAQMGGRLTHAITRRAMILDHYQTFSRMNAYRADTALRMAVNIVDKRR